MTTEEKIIDLLESTNRGGMVYLIGHLQKEGFFESPASTKFHGCYPGGLAEHSLKVYHLLEHYIDKLKLDETLSPGQKPLEFTRYTTVIAGLLHDVCKIGAYIGDEKPYKWNKQQPKGHAILSIERIKGFIKLTALEEMMITYHMGVYGLNEFYEDGSWQTGEYPLRGDHSNDKHLTKEESQEARYGKSMANAWYHNPICKLMYFCDEIATLEEKASEHKPKETVEEEVSEVPATT